MSVVYSSDYVDYGDIGAFAIEEGASDVISSPRRRANGKWRIRFFPRAQVGESSEIQIDFSLEDPEGYVFIYMRFVVDIF